MDKRVALRQLEMSLKNYYRETGIAFPDIGIVIINLDRTGIDLQYVGIKQDAIVDWAPLFASIIQQLTEDGYIIQQESEVVFESR